MSPAAGAGLHRARFGGGRNGLASDASGVADGQSGVWKCGLIDYQPEQLYSDREGVTWRVQRRSNSQRPDQVWQAAFRKAVRQRIEPVFTGPPGGQITMRFDQSIHAVTAVGFLLRTGLFLIALFARNKLVTYNLH